MRSPLLRVYVHASRLALLVLSSPSLLGCSGGKQPLVEPKPGQSSGGVGGSTTAAGGTAAGGLVLDTNVSGASNGGGISSCDGAANGDRDHDGYTVAQGDCKDCEAGVNPGAFDVADNQVDEDCSGKADDEPSDCDGGLDVAGDAVAAAKALGICRESTKDASGRARTWGLISARYVFPDGSTKSLPDPIIRPCTPNGAPNENSHGILDNFGPNVKPLQGRAFTVLSSGAARAGAKLGEGSDGQFIGPSPAGASMCTRSDPPPGIPPSSYSTCGDLDADEGSRAKAYDGIALELVLRTPTNAKGFTFDFDFYTYEYTDYVCSGFNDAFAALLYSANVNVPADHNIAFDSEKNPICVNNAFVEVCDPYTYEGTRGGQPFSRAFPCAAGTKELLGTGFQKTQSESGHAATGWLQTRADVNPGEDITLRLAIWDTRDEILDSTVLLDRFVWDAAPGKVETVRPTIVK